MARRSRRPAPREFDVLRALWSLGPSPVRDVREQLEESGTKLAYNTVQTLLNRLVEKRQVKVDRRGAAHVYRAAAPREKMIASRVTQFVQEVFEGSPVPLVTRLLRDTRLDESECEELRRLLDEHEAREEH
jgi:predicted transcriptional regulator